MTKLERKLIEQARLIVPNLIDNKHRHVSFLVVRNKIISVGWNSYCKRSMLAKKFNYYDAFVHAELNAICHANRNFNFNKATMFNVRISKDNEIRMSMPCKSCTKLLYAFNIKHCYYTCNEGGFVKYY